MIPEVFLLVKEICSRRAQVDNLGAPIAILLKPGALEAVKCIADAFSTADDALVLVVSERALIANAGEGSRAHVGIADRTFAVTFVAEPSKRDPWLLAAHNEIGMVAGHRCAAMRGEIGRNALI